MPGSGAEFWQGAGFLTAYWIIFTLAGFLSRHDQMTATKRSAFINLNNGAFFGLITITLLQTPALRDQYWVFPLVLGAALAGLHWLARRQLLDEPLLADVLLAKARVEMTIHNVTRSLCNTPPRGDATPAGTPCGRGPGSSPGPRRCCRTRSRCLRRRCRDHRSG